MEKQIKTIIFDFDGVVVNPEPLYEETGRELFSQYGVEISDNDWLKFKGLRAIAFLKIAKRLKICPKEMIVIEDSVNGVISAKRSRSKVIGLLTSFDKDILTNADY